MMRQLNELKMDKNQNMTYAPYIMALIKAKTRFEGGVRQLTLNLGLLRMRLALLPSLSLPFLMMRDFLQMTSLLSLRHNQLSKCLLLHLISSKDNNGILHLDILIHIFSRCSMGSRHIWMDNFRA
jgi:hypothetical protein